MIAAYLRVSTDRQDEELQRQAILRLLPMGQPVSWYIDHGLTGTNTDRAGYQAMMTAIRAGEVTMIYCYEWSRLWRNLADQTRDITELLKYRVTAVSATEGKLTDFEDELIVNLKGAINQHEYKRTARRRKDGTAAKYKLVAEAMSRALQEGKKYEEIPKGQRWGSSWENRERAT